MEVYAAIDVPDLFEPDLYGLTTAIRWLTPLGPHWQGGIQYDADCTEVSVTTLSCISGAPDPLSSKVATWVKRVRGARPFTVFGEVDCSVADGDWWETGATRALRALTNSGPSQVERTFWTGNSNSGSALVYPNLTAIGPSFGDPPPLGVGRIQLQPVADLIISGGTPLDIVEGLGRLESAFADCYDGRGVVHVPAVLAAALSAQNLCYIAGGKLYTYCGNQVVIGAGYPGTFGPGGVTAPAGSAWMWMTSPIFGIRGTPKEPTRVESFDRNVNTLKMIAEQTFLLGWHCCRVGVLVTTGGEPAGTPNA